MDDDSTVAVRALFAAFNAGDLDGATQLVSDDFELVDFAAGESFVGREGCRQWLQAFRTALPDAQTELLQVIADGHRVATEHVGRGTHTGPFATPAGTIPATGRTVEVAIAETYEVHEGRITRLHAYYDSATLMRQMGLLPSTGTTGERAMTTLMAQTVKVKQALKRRRRSY
ncbi:MAG TPA: ester cyclase [Acidimicrobiales bacterium]|nr:ester cyclase [Acidimicrobiales bacterium]